MSKRHRKTFWEEIKDSAKKPLQTWKKEPKQSGKNDKILLLCRVADSRMLGHTGKTKYWFSKTHETIF